MRLLDRVPDTEPLGLFVPQQVAAFGLLALNHDIDAVAGLQLRLAGVIEDLIEGNQPFGLHAYIHDDVLVGQLDDRARHNRGVVEGLRSGFRRLLAVERFERGGEVLHTEVGLVVMWLGRFFASLQFRQRPCGSFVVRCLERGFGVGGGFSRRLGVLRRGFQRWGFQFGVQRGALGLFRIEDVCHRQLRDCGGGSRIPPRSGKSG